MTNPRKASQLDVDKAFAKVRREIATEGGVQEIGYFGHEARYKRNINRILDLTTPGAILLDIGSHFLHQAAVLSELGYRVIGMDVAEFASVELIKQRARNFDIQNHAVDRLDRGDFLKGYENQIDLVVFSEIQEHITFNPIRFWQQIYHLLKIGGVIYLTTPNSLTVWKMANALKRLLTLRGYGITVEEIVDRVTYGHHWKEYSAYELRRLFRALSPDFDVTISPYELRSFEKLIGLKAGVRNLVRRASSSLPLFREELEAVITLTGRSAWHVEPPDYF